MVRAAGRLVYGTVNAIGSALRYVTIPASTGRHTFPMTRRSSWLVTLPPFCIGEVGSCCGVVNNALAPFLEQSISSQAKQKLYLVKSGAET